MGTDASAEDDIAAYPLMTTFEVWPHRSLGRGGTATLLGLISFSAALVVARFPSPAVWPVAFAMVLTVVALAAAFWANNRAARRAEVIEIGPDAVRITRRGAAGPEEVLSFKTHWVRVTLHQHRHIANRVVLSESGRSCSIGQFLSPSERLDLMAAISANLDAARKMRGGPANDA